jgi:hypothetical protein
LSSPQPRPITRPLSNSTADCLRAAASLS